MNLACGLGQKLLVAGVHCWPRIELKSINRTAKRPLTKRIGLIGPIGLSASTRCLMQHVLTLHDVSRQTSASKHAQMCMPKLPALQAGVISPSLPD